MVLRLILDRSMQTHNHTPHYFTLSSLSLSSVCLALGGCMPNPRGLSLLEPVVLWGLRCVMQHKHTAACKYTTIQVECSIGFIQQPHPHQDPVPPSENKNNRSFQTENWNTICVCVMKALQEGNSFFIELLIWEHFFSRKRKSHSSNSF